MVIFPKEVEQIEGMARALGAHPMIKAGAFDGYIERSGFWRSRRSLRSFKGEAGAGTPANPHITKRKEVI